jgi:hypothetical protein
LVWNLNPYIVFSNPNSDKPNPIVRVLIDMEKSLQHNDEVGWHWHKSWNIPNILIRIDIRDEETYESFQNPRNLHVPF